MTPLWGVLASYIGAVSLATFVLFGWDKLCSVRATRRIPEATLLWAAVWGGSPGALLGQRLFRHKIRKEPFRSRLQWIVLAHLALVSGLTVWLLFGK